MSCILTRSKFKLIGETVHYEGRLKPALHFSHKIAEGYYSRKGAGAVVSWRAEDARGQRSIVCVGSGFQTADGLGVVVEMSQDGANPVL
jgi:hypothetical protein